jgi:hypothetical protein
MFPFGDRKELKERVASKRRSGMSDVWRYRADSDLSGLADVRLRKTRRSSRERVSHGRLNGSSLSSGDQGGRLALAQEDEVG